jgi:hypothetical protein
MEEPSHISQLYSILTSDLNEVHRLLEENKQRNNQAKLSLSKSWLKMVMDSFRSICIAQKKDKDDDDDIKLLNVESTDHKLWKKCADSCDLLLNEITTKEYDDNKESSDASYATSIIRRISSTTRSIAENQSNRMKVITTCKPSDMNNIFGKNGTANESKNLDNTMNSTNNDSPVFAENEENSKKDESLCVTSSSSSAFFKPTKPIDIDTVRGRTLMSPVLGTEALYRQAGWITPQEQSQIRQLQNNNNNQSSDKVKREAEIASKEKNSFSGTRTGKEFHDAMTFIEISGKDSVIPNTKSAENHLPTYTNPLQEEAREHCFSVPTANATNDDGTIGIASLSVLDHESRTASTDTLIDVDYDDDEAEDDRAVHIETGDNWADLMTADFFPIPNSSREIYEISNRNRRIKKTNSPILERGNPPTSEKEMEELKLAEDILSRHSLIDGKAYSYLFEESSDGQQTSSCRDTEDSVLESTSIELCGDDDVAFMKEIGWIHCEKEIDDMFKQYNADSRNSLGSEVKLGSDHRTKEIHVQNLVLTPESRRQSLTNDCPSDCGTSAISTGSSQHSQHVTNINALVSGGGTCTPVQADQVKGPCLSRTGLCCRRGV